MLTEKPLNLVLQRQIIKNPTPTLPLPLKGRGFYGVFPTREEILWFFFSLSWKFFQSLPFQGGEGVKKLRNG
jgi:hypothetical protein